MIALLLALAGFAFIDSLDLLLVGVTAAIVVDSRLARKSPVPGGASFIAGVFAVTTTFGLLAVLGIDFLTTLVDFELTPTMRTWGALGFGLVLLVIAAIPAGAQAEPPAWTASVRRRPWLLGLLGMVIGLAQAPTAVPYLAGLALITARDPLPGMWPLIVVAYCALALLPPLVVLTLATRRTRAAQRVYRAVLRGVTGYGPLSVRIVFVLLGVGLIAAAALDYRYLW